MGLILTYEKEETGSVLTDAYHRISNPTVDEGDPRTLVFYLNTYVSKTLRDAGKVPENVLQYRIEYNLASMDNVYVQAYNFLKAQILLGAIDN